MQSVFGKPDFDIFLCLNIFLEILQFSFCRCVPDSINGILPSPTWLCYEKVNMYLYDGTDGNRHLFYASDARSTEALLELADELGISQIGFWHFNSVDPQMWDTTAKWQKK